MLPQELDSHANAISSSLCFEHNLKTDIQLFITLTRCPDKTSEEILQVGHQWPAKEIPLAACRSVRRL